MFTETIRGQCLQERLEYLQVGGGLTQMQLRKMTQTHSQPTNPPTNQRTHTTNHINQKHHQEIEDTIRDYAEDNAATELTPAALSAALRKAHKGTLDDLTVEAFVARAFGPDWRVRERSALASLSAVIRAVRRGGAGKADAASGPAAAAAARLQSGGGAQQQGGGKQQQRPGARRVSAGGAAPAVGRARRSTAGDDVGVGLSRGVSPGRSRRVTLEATAAAAADVARNRSPTRTTGGPKAGGGAAAGDSATAAGKAKGAGVALSAAVALSSSGQELLQRALSFSYSRQRTGGSRSGGGGRVVTNTAPTGEAAAAIDSQPSFPGAQPDAATTTPTLAGRPGSGGWRPPALYLSGLEAEGAGPAAAAAAEAPPLTPAVLSAMEAVRKAWMDEENGRSGGGGGVGSSSGGKGGSKLSRASAVISSSILAGSAGSGSRNPTPRLHSTAPAGGKQLAGSALQPQPPRKQQSQSSAHQSPRVPPLKLRFADHTETNGGSSARSGGGGGSKSGAAAAGKPAGILRAGSGAGGEGAPGALLSPSQRPAPRSSGGDTANFPTLPTEEDETQQRQDSAGASAGDSSPAATHFYSGNEAVEPDRSAPSEGGKCNAALFRKLSKHGSLWRLENVMAEVADAVTPGGTRRSGPATAPWEEE
jgi:hypothetical protein